MNHKEKIELIERLGLIGIGLVMAGGMLYIIGKKVSDIHVTAGTGRNTVTAPRGNQ